MRSFFFILLGLISITYVYKKVKKNSFSEKESFFWMFGAIVVLIMSIFPKLIDIVSIFLGIEYPPSLLFLLSTLFLIYMVFRQSQDISQLNSKVKELAQRNAILDNDLRNNRNETKK